MAESSNDQTLQEYFFGAPTNPRKYAIRLKPTYHEVLGCLDGLSADEAILVLELATQAVTRVAIVQSK